MDLHEIRNPMRHPLIASVLREEEAGAELDVLFEDAPEVVPEYWDLSRAA